MVPLNHSIVCYTVLYRVTLVAIHSFGSIPLVVPGSRGVWTVDGASRGSCPPGDVRVGPSMGTADLEKYTN